eukprot:comp5704_c0_seq1/m.1574 comp5704_c0_seq1/g.1574  ORF comp5704_c0_seq1/g.1574 comp5704_c0_seq1/m.1574 type:complete len:573 (-) comp5704_c0_seq1:598-2316(-)
MEEREKEKGPEWRSSWLAQLKTRADETDGWRVLVDTNAKLTERLKLLEKKTSDQGAELKHATAECERLQRELTRTKEDGLFEGAAQYRERIQDLEDKLERTRQELTDSYKLKGEHAQKLLDLNEEVRQKTDELGKLRVLYKEAKQLAESLAKKSEDARQQTEVDKLTIQRINDDYHALELELVQKDRTISELREDNDRLSKENMDLINRWKKDRESQAEFMNKMAEIHNPAHRRESSLSNPSVERMDGTSGRRRDDVNGDREWTVIDRFKSPSKVKQKFKGHDGEIYRVAFSADGNMFATGGNDKKLNVWDSHTGIQKASLGPLGQGVMSVGFSPRFSLVLGSSTDHCTYIWQLQTNRRQLTLTGHIGKVAAAVFSGDANKVITGSHDRTIKMFDVAKGICTRTIFAYSSCNDLVVLDDSGTEIISGHLDNSIRFWDSKSSDGTNQATNEITGIHTGQITGLALSADKNLLLTNSRDNSLKLIDLRMFQVVATFCGDGYKNSANWAQACFSPGGQYIAAGGADGVVYVWNTVNNKVEKQLKAHTSSVAACAWNWTTNNLVTCEKDKTVVIWE